MDQTYLCRSLRVLGAREVGTRRLEESGAACRLPPGARGTDA